MIHIFVKRRTFLGAVGTVGSLGAVGYATRPPVDAIDVRFWLTERAARYDGVVDRLQEYLGFALDLELFTADITYGGTVSVSREHGAEVTTFGEWPAAVIAGVAGRGDVDPVADVNLLVTDGQMQHSPTGYAIPHVASVGGARHIAAIEPLEDRPSVVPYRAPERATQVAIHEVGHALGLSHDHGVAVRLGESVVATPMLSSYAWDPTYEGDRSRCGRLFAQTDGYGRKLRFSFSRCARRELERYDGGLVPRSGRRDSRR